MSSGVTVVIPVWNGKQFLTKLLDSLDQQTLKPDLIIAVDNASTDGAAELATSRGARVISMGVNTGFAAAANRGIEESATEWIALVNSDVELRPDWLLLLVRQAKLRTAWFACGKILNTRNPELLDGLFDAVARSGCAWRVGHGRLSHGFTVDRPRKLLPSGTATLFRNQLFDRVGLFDIRFQSYLEDVDLGLRAVAAGLNGVYVEEAECLHVGSGSSGLWSAAMVENIARNQVWLIAKHCSRDWISHNLRKILFGQLLWGLLALKRGRFGAWLRGKVRGIWNWEEMRSITPGVEPILIAGEQDISHYQRRFGFDTYWKWYFRLTGIGAK